MTCNQAKLLLHTTSSQCPNMRSTLTTIVVLPIPSKIHATNLTLCCASQGLLDWNFLIWLCCTLPLLNVFKHMNNECEVQQIMYSTSRGNWARNRNLLYAWLETHIATYSRIRRNKIAALISRLLILICDKTETYRVMILFVLQQMSGSES